MLSGALQMYDTAGVWKDSRVQAVSSTELSCFALCTTFLCDVFASKPLAQCFAAQLTMFSYDLTWPVPLHAFWLLDP